MSQKYPIGSYVHGIARRTLRAADKPIIRLDAAREYQTFDLRRESHRLPRGQGRPVRQNRRLWFLFDEVLTKDDVDCKREWDCVNIISYDLEPGSYRLETIEPYT